MRFASSSGSQPVCAATVLAVAYGNIIKITCFPLLIFVIDDDYYRAYRVATKAQKIKLRTSLIGPRPSMFSRW